MTHMSRHYGFIISVFIHAIILAIPVSMVVKNKIQEVELFVLIEEARNRTEQVVAQKEFVKKEISIQKKKLLSEKVEKIVEPIEVAISKELKQEMTEQVLEEKNLTEESAQQNKINLPTEVKVQSSPIVNTIKEIEKPIDTEFGSSMAPAFLHREMPKYPLLARKLEKREKLYSG